MIEIRNVSKSYSDVKVLDDISTIIPQKCISCVIGPNGAGKSTLIRIITGFEYPDSGEVFLFGEKIKSFHMAKSLLSYMPEKMTLYPNYRVKEFLKLYFEITGERDDYVFEQLGLPEIVSKKIKNLSKGWHQRLKLYLALSLKRPFVILDEPFEGFDPLKMREIGEVLKELNKRGRSFLLSVHQLSYAEKICDYFLLLSKGRVIASGTLTQLTEKYQDDKADLEEIFIEAVSNEG